MTIFNSSKELIITSNKFQSLALPNNFKMRATYLVVITLPFVFAQTLGLAFENIYREVLSAITLIFMMCFFLQFPLAGRLKKISLFANIDWSINRHKRLGKYIGVFFFLHPFWIVIPKAFVSMDTLQKSIISMIQSPNLLTGLIAWALMAVLILMAVYKNKIKLRYETWRLIHLIGFMIVLTFATFHITKVGSHGQYNQQFNFLWWSLYALSSLLVIYNYYIKPFRLKSLPFHISRIEKISECDWKLSIETKNKQKFGYDAGQFVWLNSSKSTFNLEQHPFSISDSNNNNTKLSFIIRELGNYTCHLNELTIGQTVYVDGPYGSMTLAQSKSAEGITLVAGGVGIAPMLSLLRQLAKNNDKRPIRLLYANKNIDRMVFIDELLALKSQMENFNVELFCDQINGIDEVYIPIIKQGFINKGSIIKTIELEKIKNWQIYLCGPKIMMDMNIGYIKELGIKPAHIHYETLSF